MDMRPCLLVSSFVLCSMAEGAAAQQVRPARGAPAVHSDLSGDTELLTGELVRFTVTVTDPDERVSLRLLDPPPGLVFHPVRNAPSPSVSEITWTIPEATVPRRTELHFEARDSADFLTRFTLPVRIRTSRATVITGDVTGDGRLDVVAVASNASVGGRARGAIYVWAGSLRPNGTPTATLTAAMSARDDALGSGGIKLGDVTGDGVLDIVADTPRADIGGVEDTGAFHVWAGGPTLSGAVHESARLFVPGAIALMNLQASQLVDVTGDGVLDVVSASSQATVGVLRAGAAFVWAGGQALAGALGPHATLSVPGAVSGEEFTISGLRVADVTGDGVLDLIGGTGRAIGTVSVFSGGVGLIGSVAPSASLIPPSLGPEMFISEVHFEDVTHDGVADVVLVARTADAGGILNTGAVLVWRGGGLSGTPAPLATLTVPGAVANDGVTLTASFADVTGDGACDIVAGEKRANVGGVADTGAYFVWRGGATLGGAQAPLATLSVPGAGAGDNLDDAEFVDVSDDGILDVVASSPTADVSGVENVGEVYVWAGGAGLAGAIGPTARLNDPGALGGDSLGLAYSNGFLCADISGGGTLEIVVACPAASIGGVPEAGAIHVFPGGAALSGTVAPQASLVVPGAQPGDHLPWALSDPIRLADVSGDGVLDVIGLTYVASDDRGALYVWNGGALAGTLAPTASLMAPGAEPYTLLGVSSGAETVHISDVTKDGVLDLVVGASHANVDAVLEAGAVYVWAGGAALQGIPAPRATLIVPGAELGDSLGDNTLFLSDVSGDGAPDILVGSPYVTANGIPDAGAVFLWKSRPGLAGVPLPTATLAVPNAPAGSWLGY